MIENGTIECKLLCHKGRAWDSFGPSYACTSASTTCVVVNLVWKWLDTIQLCTDTAITLYKELMSECTWEFTLGCGVQPHPMIPSLVGKFTANLQPNLSSQHPPQPRKV